MEGAGILVILIGSAYAVGRYLVRLRQTDPRSAYRELRELLGRSILMSLEFLVAGDIIRTVVIEVTVPSVLALGLVVLIRSFLSLTLEMELTGKLPWRRPPPKP